MVYIVDSLGASSGYGLLVDKLASFRDQGWSVEQTYKWAQENKLRVHHWFFSTDLTFYVKGGRVSKVSGFVGTLLKICPLLNVSNEGKLIPRQKVIGKKAAIKSCVEKMVQFADNGSSYDDTVFISHSNCYDDAVAVKNLVEEKFPAVRGKVLINNIGSTIGCHAGPGTVALFFWGKERNN